MTERKKNNFYLLYNFTSGPDSTFHLSMVGEEFNALLKQQQQYHNLKTLNYK